MQIKRNRLLRNKRGCGIETKVRGVRAENEFWVKCDKVAKIEKTDRNELIVRVVTKYCDKRLKKLLDKQNDLC